MSDILENYYLAHNYKEKGDIEFAKKADGCCDCVDCDCDDCDCVDNGCATVSCASC